MRDFFINSFEKLISIVVVISAIVTVIAGLAALLAEGVFAGGAVLVLGGLYTVIMGGGLYLAFGIYHNTKRTADAVERLAQN